MRYEGKFDVIKAKVGQRLPYQNKISSQSSRKHFSILNNWKCSNNELPVIKNLRLLKLNVYPVAEIVFRRHGRPAQLD